MKRSYETGQSQVSIVNAALENYLENVAPESPTEPPAVSHGGNETK